MLNLCKKRIKKNSGFRKLSRKRFRVENFIVLIAKLYKNCNTWKKNTTFKTY